jgi:hypothetical protein
MHVSQIRGGRRICVSFFFFANGSTFTKFYINATTLQATANLAMFIFYIVTAFFSIPDFSYIQAMGRALSLCVPRATVCKLLYLGIIRAEFENISYWPTEHSLRIPMCEEYPSSIVWVWLCIGTHGALHVRLMGHCLRLSVPRDPTEESSHTLFNWGPKYDQIYKLHRTRNKVLKNFYVLLHVSEFLILLCIQVSVNTKIFCILSRLSSLPPVAVAPVTMWEEHPVMSWKEKPFLHIVFLQLSPWGRDDCVVWVIRGEHISPSLVWMVP